ncbi:bifunctional oligoribonuclease/PAP phosphatase NrnA [Ktedonosporobacter rubrisoli]|uniref:Bifunctional oligoribonuclease/PAP phosphatase NrnA n=1 Tax=Ktedonosporobacter rubrisoli TaxID=2509675 RepID=A0A4P6K1M8_KTERU|nr:bifunctional oligoribonuclease/PAP phosphatase NrnA [Ktedonosporobacter rubrisoli]QBD81999.1 bifunctional oligoribonuclease/PAP phosphatase NrnA [Ktedonosporobacter rubrisoli]
MDTSSYNTKLAPPLDQALVQQAMALIEPAERIALLAHEHPDGDCLGSALGLAHILRQAGKICVPACADPAPDVFAFLPDLATLQQTLGDENFDLVIALDAGELTRFGPLYERHRAFLDQATILNIDHHVSSSGCGKVNIIDPGAAATAELVVLFQQQAGLELDRDAALCLLTGLITDTASFQYTSTTPRTMEVGATLLQAGAVAETIVQPIYRTHPLAQLRLQAAVINNARTSCGGRIIWSYATDETLEVAGATAEMDDNLAGTLRDIEGVKIAAFFKSYGEPARTRLSLRSTAPYNVAEICQRFGGGGHARAAGASIDKPLPEAIPLVVQALEEAVHKA